MDSALRSRLDYQIPKEWFFSPQVSGYKNLFSPSVAMFWKLKPIPFFNSHVMSCSMCSIQRRDLGHSVQELAAKTNPVGAPVVPNRSEM